MSDYRNSNYDPNNPYRNESAFDSDVRAPNAAWGWIAAAVFLVLILAVAFGAGHKPGQPGANNMAYNSPSTTSHMTPSTVAPPSATPAPAANTAPPIAPAPAAPAH